MFSLAVAAGGVAGFLFCMAQLPMLVKAYRTKDLKSYSPSNLAIAAVGNFLYFPYVISLPFGPAFFIHLFMTAATWAMLIMWWLWRE